MYVCSVVFTLQQFIVSHDIAIESDHFHVICLQTNGNAQCFLVLFSSLPEGIPSDNQTWLAGKSPRNGGFQRNIIDTWFIFHCDI